MHFNLGFSARQILWTLTFAAELVLLVVLLGRDRARRYPWFTVGIAIFALRLMGGVLLSGRMATVNFREIMLSLNNLAAIVSLLVVIEMARRAFAGAARSLWILNTIGLLAVSVGVMTVWGPWPVWKDMAVNTLLGKLRLMQLTAEKGDMLANLLMLGLLLFVLLFGRKFQAGWSSHVRKIIIGLASIAIAELAFQGTVQTIIRTVHPHSRQEYDRIIALMERLANADSAIFLAALVWWIVWLWRDEPGSGNSAPELVLPPQ